MENNRQRDNEVRNAWKTPWSAPDRLPILSRGCHPPGSSRPSAMEAAAWLAGEEWSDAPKCVHPAIASVARWANDHIDDDQLQALWPLILASVDTAARHRPILAWRLRITAAKAQRTFRQDPLRAWNEVLDRRRQLTAPAICVVAPPKLIPPQ